MATLNIGGHRVKVDDGFLQLPPDQQQAMVDEISASLPARPGQPDMGSAGISGDLLRSNATRVDSTARTMQTPEIEAAYDVAAKQGDRRGSQQMAEAYVRREAADSPVLMGASNAVRSVARGVPIIGPFLDRANAATDALTGGDYQKRLDYEQARDRAYDEAHPVASGTGKLGGAIAGTVAAAPATGAAAAGGLMRGGINMVLGTGAKSVPGAVIRGGIAGGIQGVAGGAGETQDLTNTPELVRNAAHGGAWGVGFGALIPAALGGGRMVVDAARNAGGDALSSLSRGAQAYAQKTMGNPALLAEQQAEMARLGPQAMLADVSPEWMGVARGAAARPGTRDAIVDALASRGEGKNARLGQTMNETVGPDPVPSRINADIEARQTALGPDYTDSFSGAQRVDTTPLAETLDAAAINLRGPAQKAAQQVRKMLDIPGTNELDPNPSTLLQTRHAIDGLLTDEANPKVVAQLTAARQQVDALLAKAVPGIKDVDANFQELARQREALQRGNQVLGSGKESVRPGELAQEFTAAQQPAGNLTGPSAAGLRMREGTAGELYRIVGNNANDVAALNRLVKGEGDWNRDKLRVLFGQEKADKLLNVIDAETRFYRTQNRVTGGSDTAMTHQFGEFLNEAAKGKQIPTDVTATGVSLRGAQKLLGIASKGAGERNAARFAEELGRLSVATGQEPNRIVQALMERTQRAQSSAAFNNLTGPSGVLLSPIVRALMAPGDADQELKRRQR